MKIKQKKSAIIIALLVLTVVSFFGLYGFTKLGITNIAPKNVINKKAEPSKTPTKISCTRTSRLDNEPQYDRALSLIQQRVDENNKWWDKYGEKIDGRFKHFPPELVNCIKITKELITKLSGIEGYFTFNSKDIKTNYFPITVSSDYDFADDIVTALLLSHEMTHVQQFIDTQNGKNALSCIDSEIDAFIAQLDFYVILNNEENSSVFNRIKSDGNLHSQLQILDEMMTINRDSNCKFDKNCLDTNLTTKLRKMITEDSYYKKQCGL